MAFQVFTRNIFALGEKDTTVLPLSLFYFLLCLSNLLNNIRLVNKLKIYMICIMKWAIISVFYFSYTEEHSCCLSSLLFNGKTEDKINKNLLTMMSRSFEQNLT